MEEEELGRPVLGVFRALFHPDPRQVPNGDTAVGRARTEDRFVERRPLHHVHLVAVTDERVHTAVMRARAAELIDRENKKETQFVLSNRRREMARSCVSFFLKKKERYVPFQVADVPNRNGPIGAARREEVLVLRVEGDAVDVVLVPVLDDVNFLLGVPGVPEKNAFVVSDAPDHVLKFYRERDREEMGKIKTMRSPTAFKGGREFDLAFKKARLLCVENPNNLPRPSGASRRLRRCRCVPRSSGSA